MALSVKQQLADARAVPLDAIWGAKLRSFMTVLGNIVAVTSIIAVVSLIQGLNATVSDLIVSDIGADSFTIQRMPPIRTEADEERVRANPRITLTEASAIKRIGNSAGSTSA